MKELKISRKTPDGIVSYRTRTLDTIDERELALQELCVPMIQAGIEQCGKAKADDVVKLVLSTTAMVHSTLERILREHKKAVPK